MLFFKVKVKVLNPCEVYFNLMLGFKKFRLKFKKFKWIFVTEQEVGQMNYSK